MGYRSDVYCEIKLKGKTAAEVKQEVENFMGRYKLYDIFDEVYKTSDESLCVIAHSVKWYSDFDDVEAFTYYIDHIRNILDEDEDKETFIYFCRIGEDIDDTEEYGIGYNVWSNTHMALTRTVDCSGWNGDFEREDEDND